MDQAVQKIATGTSNFFVEHWVPILLDPHTWIALVVSWAIVDMVKQFSFIYRRPPGVRRDINRAMGFVVGFLCAYTAYRFYVQLPRPYIPAGVLAVLSPWIYRVLTAMMDNYSFTKKILDAVKPHRRNKPKFVPIPKERYDDETTYRRNDEE